MSLWLPVAFFTGEARLTIAVWSLAPKPTPVLVYAFLLLGLGESKGWPSSIEQSAHQVGDSCGRDCYLEGPDVKHGNEELISASS